MTLTYLMVTKHRKWYLQISDTIHADSLTLFELNIEMLLADVTKPEKLNILTLTWPVTSLVTPRSLKFVFPPQFFQGFQMPFEFLEWVQYFRRSGGSSSTSHWGVL